MTNGKKINKSNVEDILALTSLQEGMLFHHLQDPQSDEYFEQLCIQLNTENIEAILVEKALEYITKNNGALRTLFRWEKVDNPIQIVLKKHLVDFRYIDGTNEEDIEGFQQKIKVLDRLEKFDLRSVPFRATLCKMTTQTYMLIISHHHILYDGWSMGIIMKELFYALKQLRNGKSLISHPKPLFKEFIKFSQKQDKRKQTEYWKNYLAGFDQQTNLTSALHQIQRKRDMDNYSFIFSKEKMAILNSFLQRNQITMATLLYTTWGVLLQRYTNHSDIVFGTTISGRAAAIPNINDMTGLLINTLPLRVKMDEMTTFQSILQDVEESLRGREEYESTSLLTIKKSSELSPTAPLFDTIFVIENYPLDESLLVNQDQSMQIDFVSFSEQNHYDLTINVLTKEQIHISISYNKSVFNNEYIAELARHYTYVIEQFMIMGGEELLSTLRLLTPHEEEQLLSYTNTTNSLQFAALTIQELLEKQVMETPDAIAVVDKLDSITYEELHVKSNQLAHLLREKGAAPGKNIAIMVERSINMIVAMLATLKAGAAYIPLDPEFPEERLSLMTSDSDAIMLLTQTKYKERISFKSEIILLDDQKLFEKEKSSLIPINNPDDLAYVIYTSGSTGVPKGVMIPHKAVVNLINGISEQIPFDTGKIFVSVTTFSFDIFVLETFIPLAKGLTVILADEEAQTMPEKLADLIQKYHADMIQLTPSRMRLLLETQAGCQVLAGLKEILIGGEAFPPTLLAEISEKTSATIYNMYGPTETTVWSLVKNLSESSAITIGKPIAGTKCYVLNHNNSVQPIGVLGELYIAGNGLAKGYWKQPERTNQVFVTNPFVKNDEVLMYRTGDLARWLPNGELEFAGRIDYQVKVRGYRIELGEIENHLLTYSGMQSTAVIIRGEHEKVQIYAYYTAEREASSGDLREYLSRKLPAYMIPSTFIYLENMPLTLNGKLDRKKLPLISTILKQSSAIYEGQQTGLEKIILKVWKEVLGKDFINLEDNFFDLGGTSVDFIRVSSKLTEILGYDVPIVTLFAYANIRALSKHISREEKTPKQKSAKQRTSYQRSDSSDIAIIGMAGRFPGAKNLEEFWHNLSNGVESIQFFDETELLVEGINPDLVTNPQYIKAKGVMEDIEYFDAPFFNYTENEVKLMDPQIRLLHECSYTALDHAGYHAKLVDKPIGFYAGATTNLFWIGQLVNRLNLPSDHFAAAALSDSHSLATRISYKLDLRGPSFTVQTACSTSLVAIHLACQSLLSGESGMALAGGVSLLLPKKSGYLYQEGMTRSPDGHCRAFDHEAKGTVGGDGVGLVVLKRLTDALEDGDEIHAVIKGSAINNDGLRKAGFTAPSVEGQAEVIRTAHKVGNIEPETISFLEAHGTGTVIGDPIEIEGLKQAFSTEKTGFCAIGSVKSNIGHLDAAAGVAGLIKTVLSLKHQVIPPSINFTVPNPKIDFTNSPFYVNTEEIVWKQDLYPRRAGVSSFGIGGTNAHIVLEEAPISPSSPPSLGQQIIPLSAKSLTALQQMRQELASYLQVSPALNLSDVAYTLQMGRGNYQYRMAYTGSTVEEIVKDILEQRDVKIEAVLKEPSVVFLFTGQGSQYVDMGYDLYEQIPEFRTEMDHCFSIIKSLMSIDLKEVLYPTKRENKQTVANILDQTEITQVVIFVFAYALAQLLTKYGVRPKAMLGHSIGEYVAACLSGVFTLEEALEIVVYRGKLMQGMPKGRMISISLSEKEVLPYLSEGLSIAAVNSFTNTVVAGETKAILKLEEKFHQKGIHCAILHTSHAFHSEMMDPILLPFSKKMREIILCTPKIPYISNLSGKWITEDEVKDPNYWSKHLRMPVQFADGLETLCQEKDVIFIEVGAGKTLSTFARRHLREENNHYAVSLIRHLQKNVSDHVYFYNQLAEIWKKGVDFTWRNLHKNDKRRRIVLPTYPFDRHQFGLTLGESLVSQQSVSNNLTNCFYKPYWEKVDAPHTEALKTDPWLLFVDGSEEVNQLIKLLDQTGQFYMPVYQTEDYTDQLEVYQQMGILTVNIVHAWLQTDGEDRFYHLLALTQALGKLNRDMHFIVSIITKGTKPQQALVHGFCHVVAQEYINMEYRSIEIEEFDKHLYQELNRPYTDAMIAIRSGKRYLQKYESIQLPKTKNNYPVFQENGTYLITGGTGGIGLSLAKQVAQTTKVNFVLTTRQFYPKSEECTFDQWCKEKVVKESLFSFANPSTVKEAIHLEAELLEQLNKKGITAYPGLKEAIDMLCSAYVYNYFQSMIDTNKGQTYNLHELVNIMGILPNFEKLYRMFIRILEEDQIIQVEGNQLTFVKKIEHVPQSVPLHAQLSQRYPTFVPLFDLIQHCANHYQQALSGQIYAINVLYPEGDSTFIINTMKKMAKHTYEELYISMLQRLITKALKERRGNNKVRILEVGGGNGVLTKLLLPMIAHEDIDYHFTDIGTSFVAQMKQEAETSGWDFMQFARLDISQDPVEQGFSLGSFDLILGLNVVHATDRILVTSEQLKNMLRPKGTLCLIESIKQQRWVDMVWGLAEGWWYFEDHELRTESPIINLDKWKNSLEKIGFEQVVTFPQTPKLLDDSDTGLIMATQPAYELTKDMILETWEHEEATWENLQHIKEQVRSIEQTGANVLVLQADVSRLFQMKEAIVETLACYGKINGVIHAAGIPDGALIQQTSNRLVAEILSSKVQGTLVLNQLIEQQSLELDFFVLCSSLASVLGSMGSLVYSSANAFLDAFAQFQASQGKRIVSINWDRWNNIGLAIEAAKRHESVTGEKIIGGMSEQEGIEAFLRVVQSGLPQVVVSTEDLANRILQRKQTEQKKNHMESSLNIVQNNTTDNVEQNLVDMLKKYFGEKEIAPNDDWFELGADSLMMLTISARIKKEYGVDIPLSDMFNQPSVRNIAKYLKNNASVGKQLQIQPIISKEHYALSYAQKRLFALHQFGKSN